MQDPQQGPTADKTNVKWLPRKSMRALWKKVQHSFSTPVRYWECVGFYLCETFTQKHKQLKIKIAGNYFHMSNVW